MITLHFDKLYNVARPMEPCFISIPVEQGKIYDVSNIRLFQNNTVIPSQTKITSKWKDGSARYLFTRFLTDLPANKSTDIEYDLNSNKSTNISFTPVRYRKVSNGYSVSNGILSFDLANNNNSLFPCFNDGNRNFSADSFQGPFIKDASGTEYLFSTGEWDIIEKGDICVIFSTVGSLRGANTPSLPCEIRLTLYSDKPWLEIAVRLVNATPSPLAIASYSFYFREKSATRTCVASSNYKTSFDISENGEAVEKEISAQMLLNQGNEHFAEVMYGTFFADWTDERSGLCATVFQAHQNYPKAVKAHNDGLDIYLVPENGEPVVMQSGMAKEQRFMLHFHNASETLEEINSRSLIYQMPDRPVISSDHYKNAKVMPDIFVQSKDFESEIALVQCADAHARAYGMMNWGDAPDPNYTSQGKGNGRLVWTNNEYDFPHACMLLYAKNGTRRFLDYALVAGEHQRDVDVCHYSDDPLKIGGQWEHSNDHILDTEIVCSHEWVEGLLDCYHATGDERYLATALGEGENVLRLLDTPAYQKNGGLSARETGWALRSLTALYVETWDMKWISKCDWIVSQFWEWFDRFGGWLAPYTDNVVIRVPFMIAVAVGSLMRYYREFPQNDIRVMILSAVDDMIDNCILDNGLFYYKELPSLNRLGNNPLPLEALAIAYELTGDKKYIEAGIPTYKRIRQGMNVSNSSSKRVCEDAVIVGNVGTKHFAQAFIPFATFYKAVSDIHSI